jgi:hypothetical protein
LLFALIKFLEISGIYPQSFVTPCDKNSTIKIRVNALEKTN